MQATTTRPSVTATAGGRAFTTDTRVGQLARLDARHRAHARVEDRIPCAKDTGLDHFPSNSFALNQAWLRVVMKSAACRMLARVGARCSNQQGRRRFAGVAVAEQPPSVGRPDSPDGW